MPDFEIEQFCDARQLATATGAEQFADDMLKHITTMFDKNGYLRPVAFIILTADPETGAELPAPSVGLLEGDMGTPVQDEVFATAIRSIAKRTRSIGVLHFFESVVVSMVDSATGDEELDMLLDAQEAGVHPETKQVVFAVFEHLRWSRPQVWEAEIMGEGKGWLSLGAFEKVDSAAVPFKHNLFSGWLRHFN